MKNEEYITPQVGDVWQNIYDQDSTVSMLHVGSTKCFVMWDDGSEAGVGFNLIHATYKLIERDGKPYKPERVLEDRAYYPALMHTGVDDIDVIVQYHALDDTCRVGGMTACTRDKFSWIGEKLEIEWPEGYNH